MASTNWANLCVGTWRTGRSGRPTACTWRTGPSPSAGSRPGRRRPSGTIPPGRRTSECLSRVGPGRIRLGPGSRAVVRDRLRGRPHSRPVGRLPTLTLGVSPSVAVHSSSVGAEVAASCQRPGAAPSVCLGRQYGDSALAGWFAGESVSSAGRGHVLLGGGERALNAWMWWPCPCARGPGDRPGHGPVPRQSAEARG